MRSSSRWALFSLLGPVALMVVVFGCASVAVAAQSPGKEGGTGRKALKHHKGHKSERGPRGKPGKHGARGPAGPQGPTGPQGPPGTGIQFGESLATNVSPRVVFDQSGVRIEAGCSSGAVEMTVRATSGDHNIIEVTSFDNSEGGLPRGVSAFDIAVNLPVSMLAGGSGLHDYNGLLSVRSLGGEVVTAQWFAMGSAFTSQGDCVVGGTVSP